MSQPGRLWLWLLLPALLVTALLFAAPLAGLFTLGFHESNAPGDVSPDFSLANYSAFLTDPFYLAILGRTLALGAAVVLCCLAIGFPVAYFLARAQSRWRGLAAFLVVAPLLVSAIVRNLGWFPLLGESGVLNWLLGAIGLTSVPLRMVNNFTGVVIGLTHALLPFMILTLTNVIQRVAPDLEEAAANLGAAPFAAFWRVLLPLTLPGMVAGSLLAFTMAISAYTTPAILGGGRVLVMATYIAQQFQTVLDYPAGATAATLLLLTAGGLTLLALRLRVKGLADP